MSLILLPDSSLIRASTLFSQPTRGGGSISSNRCQHDSIRVGSSVASTGARVSLDMVGPGAERAQDSHACA